MNPRTHKVLSMASQAHVIVNEEEGTRYTIERVDWDEHTIYVVDNMDEYSLHVDDICLDTDKFFRMEPLDPVNF